MEANPCGEGQVSVTNYDSAGNNIGTTCCEMKKDQVDSSGYGVSDYTVVGAINGTCCGDYGITKIPPRTTERSFRILVNGGVAYCARDYVDKYPNGTVERQGKHVSPRKYCGSPYYCPDLGECFCVKSGDPLNVGTGGCLACD